MKLAKTCSMIFAAVGAALMLGTIVLCLFSLDAPVEMIGMPKEAMACAEEMMDALAEGDFASAAQRMYGQPELGAEGMPDDAMSAQVWQAFLDSISYEFVGVCYAEDSGIYRDVSITVLDVPALMETLPGRVSDLAARKMESAEDMEALYDESGHFRPELVQEVLREALNQALEETTAMVSHDATLKLIHRDGQWWVVPDQALLQAISGGAA